MINKLREILCEVDEIKEDLMELRFWCEIILDNKWNKWIYINEFDVKDIDYNENINIISDYGTPWLSSSRWLTYDRTIWNKIEYHHLLMYCEKKLNNWYKYSIWNKRIVWTNIKTKDFWYVDWIQLDNTKSLHNQSDEVIEKIINFLTENKWQKF